MDREAAYTEAHIPEPGRYVRYLNCRRSEETGDVVITLRNNAGFTNTMTVPSDQWDKLLAHMVKL